MKSSILSCCFLTCNSVTTLCVARDQGRVAARSGLHTET